MKRRIDSGRLLALLSLLLVLLAGCASLFAPGEDTVTINTIPEGAKVFDGANLLGTTPVTHAFRRETFQKKTLTIRKEGFKSQDIQLGTSLESTALLNFAFFTTLGATSWGTDATNGNMVKYYPNSYLIDLEKEGAPAVKREETSWMRLRFVAVNQDNLQSDIARGDGEYLRAYFEIRSQAAPADYQAFLASISRRARHLLSLDNPVEFYESLEVI